MTDQYQARYLAHRKRKAETLAREALPVAVPLTERRSIRKFAPDKIPSLYLQEILAAAQQCPQSCNRQALRIKVIAGDDLPDVMLPGGKGWLVKAPTVFLLFADLEAYKSPVERDFMPWLDAGVMMATITYAAAGLNVGSCIVNPHIRPDYLEGFNKAFNPEGRLFCGAVALGYAAEQPERPEKKPLEELVEWLT